MPKRGVQPKPKRASAAAIAYESIASEAEEKEKSNLEMDETAKILNDAAKLMQQAATTKSHRHELLKAAEEALGKLRIVDFPELAESPIVQNFLKAMGMEGLRPGEVRNKGTLAERARDWTWRDVGEMPKVRFTPAETINLTFNGLQLRVQEDVECEVPRCFYDIYREHRQALQEAKKNEAYLLGVSDIPPDPNWQTPEGALVRAYSIQGRPYGRMGGHIGVGPLLEGEE